MITEGERTKSRGQTREMNKNNLMLRADRWEEMREREQKAERQRKGSRERKAQETQREKKER